MCQTLGGYPLGTREGEKKRRDTGREGENGLGKADMGNPTARLSDRGTEDVSQNAARPCGEMWGPTCMEGALTASGRRTTGGALGESS